HRRTQPHRHQGAAAAHGMPAALWRAAGRQPGKSAGAVPSGIRHALMSPTLVIRGARVLDALAPEPRPAVRDIVISGDRITAVEPPGDAPAGAKTLDARDMLAIPGLVSAHYHSHDTLLKGCFAPMPLEAWLLHAVPPNYPQRSREEIRARVLIGALEALKSGITTLQDMATVHPFDPAEVDTIAQAYDDIGIRCVLALQVGDVPGSRPLPFWDEVIPPELRGAATVTVRRGGSARELIERIDGERLAHVGEHVALSAAWSLKARSGIAPVRAYLDDGVALALGTGN